MFQCFVIFVTMCREALADYRCYSMRDKELNSYYYEKVTNVENLPCDISHVFCVFQCFVIFVTMCREALDDYRRYSRDKELNSHYYKKLTRDGIVPVPSSHIQVSDLIIVEKVRYY